MREKEKEKGSGETDGDDGGGGSAKYATMNQGANAGGDYHDRSRLSYKEKLLSLGDSEF